MQVSKYYLMLALLLYPGVCMGNNIKPQILPTSIGAYSGNGRGYMGFLLERGVRFFQVFISPIDSDRCSAYPTCSTYSRQAFKKHGAFWGYLLTFDRLLHEGNESLTSDYIFDNGRLRVFDPVINNTFWWDKKGRKIDVE